MVFEQKDGDGTAACPRGFRAPAVSYTCFTVRVDGPASDNPFRDSGGCLRIPSGALGYGIEHQSYVDDRACCNQRNSNQ